MLQTFLLMIQMLTVESAEDLHLCGSMEIQPCPIYHGGYERKGFKCETTRGESCLVRHAWCNIGPAYIENNRCNSSENLMFDSCLSIEKEIGGNRYHVNIANVDWQVAEQYCQRREMNLASFGNQQEYDLLLEFLKTISDQPEHIPLMKGVEYTDKLAQRCWAFEKGYGIPIVYWSGLFFNHFTNTWNYSDGTEINEHIRAGHVRLGHALRRHDSSANIAYVAIMDRNYDFVVDGYRESAHRVDSLSYKARVLCKSSKDKGLNRKWGGGIQTENSGCMTGFKCKGRQPACITGPMFEESEVCNGKFNCPELEDESAAGCHLFSLNFPDNSRVAHFIPLKRKVTTTKRICQLNNYTLPSVRSQADLEFLRTLPVEFAKSRRSPDFLLSSQDWKNLNWSILLGVRPNAAKWDDGSPITYFADEIYDLASDGDVYMTLDSAANAKLTAIHQRIDEIFPVCQEKDFGSMAVLVTVPTSGKAVLSMHAYAFLLILRLSVVTFAV